MLDHRLGQRDVPAGPVDVIGHPQAERRDPPALGPGQPFDARPVGPDRDDLGREAGLRGGVEQRLQERAGARDQHHHARRYGNLHAVGQTGLRSGSGTRPPP